MMRDDLREAKRRPKPVPDGEPMPHHARDSLSGAETEQYQRPPNQRRLIAFDDPVLDRAADRERHQSLGQHPRDTEADPGEQRRDLVLTNPDEQPNRRPRIRRAGVAKRKLDQGSVRSIAVCGRVRASILATALSTSRRPPCPTEQDRFIRKSFATRNANRQIFSDAG